jgi:hypothetical protein
MKADQLSTSWGKPECLRVARVHFWHGSQSVVVVGQELGEPTGATGVQS